MKKKETLAAGRNLIVEKKKPSRPGDISMLRVGRKLQKQTPIPTESSAVSKQSAEGRRLIVEKKKGRPGTLLTVNPRNLVIVEKRKVAPALTLTHSDEVSRQQQQTEANCCQQVLAAARLWRQSRRVVHAHL